jgi:hypothetical protein
MKTLVDEQLKREVRVFRLQFTCADCIHFDAVSATCAEGYPNDEHLSADLEERENVLFCKLFEGG